jgi:hypothetical protein
MIKIAIANIDSVIDGHYKRILAVNGKEQNVVKRLTKRINDAVPGSSKQSFLKKLKHDVLNSKNSLITAKPKQLQNFIYSYETNYSSLLGDKDFRDDLLTVFYYGNYDKWNAYQLAKDIGVQVCPYCNRQYTFTVGTSDLKGTRPQFDHFFDKATYPFLALSFYNLVPSCSICNSSLKGTDKFNLRTHVHPYLGSFSNKMKFSIANKNIKFLNGVPSDINLELKEFGKTPLNRKDFIRINNTVKSFRLMDLYNQHKDYVVEIVQKSIAYNNDYYEALYQEFNGTLFNSVDDVKRMVLSNYIAEDELGKRVLSKLTKDIAEDLGIL